MNTIVKAGAEEFVWIIVGIFWVVAQIAGAAAKKKKAPSRPVSGDETREPPVPSRVEGAEDPFAELIRKLSGVQEIKAPTPPKPVDAVSPPRSLHVPNAVGTQHLQEEKPAPTPKSIPVVEAIAEVDIRPTMSSFRSAMPSMKFPSMKMSFQPSGKSTGNVPRVGKIINPADKKSLRRAMLSHIILSPAKAFDGVK